MADIHQKVTKKANSIIELIDRKTPMRGLNISGHSLSMLDLATEESPHFGIKNASYLILVGKL